MEIKSTLTNRSGQELKVVYREQDPLKNLADKKLQAVHGLCFHKEKLVIVYSNKKGYWTPPGGKIEEGETYEDALVREIREETNMRVLHHELIGYQDIYEPDRIVRQTRSFCLVEPYGKFTSDPDGDITEIKLIDPSEHQHYFNWGVIGDHLIKRSLDIAKKKYWR